MARAFFQDGAFFEPNAFFQEGVVVVPPPANIHLGDPGEAEQRLLFRALGGSVIDLDLLYGVLGQEGAEEDIQYIFALGTRAGQVRTFSKEIPRQGIRDAVLECYATLRRAENIRIEGSPIGANLFGSMGLSTRPTSTVTIGNADGLFYQLSLEELLLGVPCGMFLDIAHTVVAPLLTGTILGITIGADVQISYGFSQRKRFAVAPSD